MDFQPLATDELKAIVHSFNFYKASGVDNIPIGIINLSIDIIVEPLIEIINLSLVSGCFPDSLKIAKVLPIFKTGDPEKLKIIGPFPFFQLFLNFMKKCRLLEFSSTFRKLLTLLIIIFCSISSITTVLGGILLILSLAI